MANVPGTFYTAETQRRGTTPVSPPSAVDDPQDPVNPSGPPVVPPVAERYASEAAMIADQLNQKSGYLYFDGTATWWYLGISTADISDYQAFGSSGGSPPVAGSYASQAAMIAAQGSQVAQYFYFDSAKYWEYLGTTTGTIADYRDFTAGVRDTDAVHYDASDGKTLSERQQANNNMLSIGLNATTVATSGRLDDIATPTDVLIITSSQDLTGFVPTTTGFLRIIVKNGTYSLVRNSSSFSSASNRIVGLSSNVRINTNSYFDLFYDTAQSKWIPMGYQQIKANGAAGNANSNSFRGNSSLATINIFEVENAGSTVVFAVQGAGNVILNNAADITVGTATGTKIGTGTTQKIGFWNATPIIQPTTGVSAATFTANTSGIANDTATFDGYTIGQIVKALRNAGLLA